MFASTTNDIKLCICTFYVIEPFCPSVLLISQSTALTHKVVTLRRDNKSRFFLKIGLATI